MEQVWQFLLNQGVSVNDITSLKHTFLILILLPFVITIYGITRHIIGLKNISLYVTVMITFAFIEFGYVGNDNFDLKRGYLYGLLMLINIVITSLISFYITKKTKIHYIPKLAIIITTVAITSIILVFLSLLLSKSGFVLVSSLTLVIMVMITEGIITILAKKDINKALSILAETLITSTIIYLLITISQFQSILMDSPYLIILLYPFNYYIGKYKGLRVTEYWRFRKVIFNQDLLNEPKSDRKK
jgi:hypothetical protein